MKLATKLIIGFSLLLAMMTVVLGIYLGTYITKFQHDQTLQTFYSMVKMADASYEGFKQNLRVKTVDWASDGYVRMTTEKLLSTKGRERDVLVGQLGDYFREKKLIYDQQVMLLEVLDKDGIVIVSSHNKRIGINEKEEKNGFKEAIQGDLGEAFVEDIVVEEDENLGMPMNHVTTRIFALSSTIEKPVPLDAVLLLHFTNTNEIKNALVGNWAKKKDVTSMPFMVHYASADIYLVNSKRLMTVPSRFVKNTALKQRVNTSPVKSCLEDHKDFSGEYVNYLGKKVLGVGECIDDGKNVLVFEVEKEEALSFIKDIYLRMAIITLVMMFLGFVGSIFFSHFFLKDLVALTGMIKTIADKKDFSTRITDVPSGEIGILSRSFNYLLDSLDVFQQNVLQSETKLNASTMSLEQKASELERMNKLMVGRELKMIELKEKIKQYET